MPEWVFWGAFGLIIGSFLNVLILRHGIRGILGRSSCPSCKRELAWFELVPVLSWIALRGKCRTCRARISVQYPLVEFLTGAGFAVIGLAPLLFAQQVLACAIFALFISIAVYDLYHTIIPDVWSYPLALLALLYALVGGAGAWELLAGPLVALPLFCFWFFSKGAWMGLGDAKLALSIGFLLGILDGFLALMLAFVVGAFVGVFILIPLPIVVRSLRHAGITSRIRAKEITMKSEVPFGPFLICATLLVWFSQVYALGLAAHLVDFLSLNF
nr:hypothetical protein [uncultured bacterium]